jgi:serine protease Do
MDFPRFPDWLIYLAVASAILIGAVSRQERADTPEPPPPPPGAESVPLGPDSPFEPIRVIRTASYRYQARGTAFAVAEGGLWVTARSALADCERFALKVSEGRAVRAQLGPGDDPAIAILTTPGGPPGLPLAEGVGAAERGYLIGFPRGGAGEIAVLYLGQTRREPDSRGGLTSDRLIWAEAGRTDNLHGRLAGAAGTPVLNADHEVVGVVTGHSPRRARFYSTGPQGIEAALAAARASRTVTEQSAPITAENYGRMADDLRRGRQIAQVICLLN